MEARVEIRWLRRAERMPVRGSASEPGIARSTVRGAMADDVPLDGHRAPSGSVGIAV
ncbi:hypothetical protein ACIOKD_40440 [Streptomyces sp. NPDC087844]|uniref:hypothetical protein n=1 Tax=Streptomyces sp. NPDC087844 TaxID=3365805 RepID=UPI00381B9E1F